MRIPSNKLIDEFYEEFYKDSNLTKKQVADAVKYQFKFTKQEMASGRMMDIRLKYFGKFYIPSFKIEARRRVLKNNLDKGKITKEKYDEKIKDLDNYIER